VEKMLNKLLAVFLFLVILPAVSYAGPAGKTAPAFTLESLDGKTVTLADFRGKVVFLDFWASWCPPCKKEMPEIAKLAKKFSPSGLAVVAISVDKKKEHAKAFISTVPGSSGAITVLHDQDSSVVAAYMAQAMPTSFIIDNEGVVRFVHFGYREEDPAKWVEEIESLLKGK